MTDELTPMIVTDTDIATVRDFSTDQLGWEVAVRRRPWRWSTGRRERTSADGRCTLSGSFHWGHAWTLAAWCELRADHRVFRLDRIEEATTLPGTVPDEPPSTLEAFLATVRPPT